MFPTRDQIDLTPPGRIEHAGHKSMITGEDLYPKARRRLMDSRWQAVWPYEQSHGKAA
jgi:hypothetical protein